MVTEDNRSIFFSRASSKVVWIVDEVAPFGNCYYFKPNCSRNFVCRTQSYDPLFDCLAVLPLIWISYDSSCDKKAWMTCRPPWFLIFSSRRIKSVPLPKEFVIKVIKWEFTAFTILEFLTEASCYSVRV
jgi:hypothetical protein